MHPIAIPVLALCALGQESELNYESPVEIIKTEAKPVAGKKRMYSIDLLFNLAPEVPKGVKLGFQLQREGIQVGDTYWFTLENDSHKNIKFPMAPKEHLATGKYFFVSLMPLVEQLPEARKAIEAKGKRFPADREPWPFSHTKQEFQVGGEAAEAQDTEDFKKFIDEAIDQINGLNGEAIDELEKHKKSFKKDDLKKFLGEWTKKMGKVQLSLSEFSDQEAGLLGKGNNQLIHSELMDLARMVGKRITKLELTELLGKNSVPPSEFRFDSKGYDPDYRYKVTAETLKQKMERLDNLIGGPKDEAAKPEDGAEGTPPEGKGEGSGDEPGAKGDDGKGSEDGKDEGKDEKKPDEKKVVEKKDSEKKDAAKKDSKSKDKKKSKKSP